LYNHLPNITLIELCEKGWTGLCAADYLDSSVAGLVCVGQLNLASRHNSPDFGGSLPSTRFQTIYDSMTSRFDSFRTGGSLIFFLCCITIVLVAIYQKETLFAESPVIIAVPLFLVAGALLAALEGLQVRVCPFR
jgi:hypothetical protein